MRVLQTETQHKPESSSQSKSWQRCWSWRCINTKLCPYRQPRALQERKLTCVVLLGGPGRASTVFTGLATAWTSKCAGPLFWDTQELLPPKKGESLGAPSRQQLQHSLIMSKTDQQLLWERNNIYLWG